MAIIPPSYTDAHCHILPTGLDLNKLHLGAANTHREVFDLLRARHEERPEGWLLAVHYDQNRYDGVHITKQQLDAVFRTRPVLLRHVSGHAGVANSTALSAAGITEGSTNPEGGEFNRDAIGNLTGVLLEHALGVVSNAIPNPSLEEMVQAILAAGRHMRKMGIVRAADMHTGFMDLPMELEAYRLASERGCEIETRLYLRWSSVFGPKALPAAQLQAAIEACRKTEGRSNSTRISGIKIFADGAIGSSTAAVYGAYAHDNPERKESGSLIYAPEKFRIMVKTAADTGYQVSVHSIGDRSTDLVMDAFEETGDPSRHRIEHAMLLNPTQISRLAGLGCFVCVQPEFLTHFGPTYRRQLGPQRAAKLIPCRSLLDAGIRLSFSSDMPITEGNPKTGIEAATNRPEGFDPSENCTKEEARTAYTKSAAEVCGDRT